MLPKQYRLPLRTELVKVQKQGKLIQGNFFSLLTAEKKDSRYSRFAFIVSNKIHKKATQRNRIRRLLSEAIINFLPQIKPGFDSIFLVKKLILDKKLPEIKKEVDLIFKKAGIFVISGD